MEDRNSQIESIQAEANRKVEQAKKDALVAQEQQLEAEKNYRKLEEEKHSLTATVCALQSASLRSVESTRWQPLSSSDIEHQINSILRNIREWSIAYTPLSIDQVLNARIFELFAFSLTRHQCLESPEKLRDTLSNNKLMQKENRAAVLPLTAAVTTAVFEKLLGDPFHAFVAKGEQEGLLQQRDGAAVDAVYHFLRGVDQSGAEAWRWQFLRLLDQTPIAANRRTAAGVGFVDEFLAELIKPGDILPEEMRTALLKITNTVAELSRTLWSRRPRIVVMDFVALRDQLGPSSELLFRGDSDFLEASPLHNRTLDDDPQALDGQEVVLVCSPAVVAFGDRWGEGYDKFHVLKKAVVWMG